MNFTAIDFETANNHPSSVCSVGLAIVENGKLIHSFAKLIQPVPNYYSYWNMEVHGIMPHQTENEPHFGRLWIELKPFLENQLLVAHNAPFDMGALRSVTKFYGLVLPSAQYICSCNVSRKVFKELPNHKLSTVCSYLNVPLNHHEAESDAIGSAQIILKAMEQTESENLNAFLKKTGITTKTL